MQWAVENFGPIARNRDERAARVVEEAIELAQAEGVALDLVLLIAQRVYARPPGSTAQEIGGLLITVDALAENRGIDAQYEAQKELVRITTLPKEHWQKKHAEKVAAGTADLSQPPNGKEEKTVL
jgi:hypothetical protein